MLSTSAPPSRLRPGTTLAIIALAVLAINVDTTIVNVALPSLVRDLGASDTELQWIVDAYNLAFGTLVLLGGMLGDRFGRRRMLVGGLLLFGMASGLGSLATDTASLIAARALMGVGAAAVFPATLSILSRVYVDRRARAAAFGVWGATAGAGVALGPIAGGWLLEHYWWGSIFVAMMPPAVLVAGLAVWLVPQSRNSIAVPIDVPGLATSTAALGALVWTIIEAPRVGWISPQTSIGLALSAALWPVLVLVERRRAHPLISPTLLTNRRFTAASVAVAISFFCLFGFMFMIAQYFQLVLRYGPFETGVRTLPVAVAVAVSSIVGVRASMVVGNKLIIAGGLALMGTAFAWISTVGTDTSYAVIAAQMVVAGIGMGFTSAPATESIMGEVPLDAAGIGSAISDATRIIGGTLGVAVIGSVFSTAYTGTLRDSAAWAHLPDALRGAANDSYGTALALAHDVDPGGRLADAATVAFLDGLSTGCLVASAVAVAGALFVAIRLPAHPRSEPVRARDVDAIESWRPAVR